MPRPLEEQLAKDRRDILALNLSADHRLALDLTIFALARDIAGNLGPNDIGCTIKIGDRADPAGLTNVPASVTAEQLELARSSLDADWAREPDSFASFLAFRALDDETRASWLAMAVGFSLKASLASGALANDFQTKLGALLAIEPAQEWRPTAERFFDRIKKASILSVLGSIDPTMPGRYAIAKKAELSSAAAKLCAGETIVEPAIKQRALAWMPEVMTFTVNAEDGEAEPATPPVDEQTPPLADDNVEDFDGSDGSDADALNLAANDESGQAELAAAA